MMKKMILILVTVTVFCCVALLVQRSPGRSYPDSLISLSDMDLALLYVSKTPPPTPDPDCRQSCEELPEWGCPAGTADCNAQNEGSPCSSCDEQASSNCVEDEEDGDEYCVDGIIDDDWVEPCATTDKGACLQGQCDFSIHEPKAPDCENDHFYITCESSSDPIED